MRLRFTHDGAVGTIEVRCERNDEPSSLGCRPGSLGLPACTATVAFEARGYRAMFGWVQLVRSGDNASAGAEFEMDPFSLFADADSPYCFYGHLPTLFDAPGRGHRNDMAWLAHSFLAASPLRAQARLVSPVAGFCWGFDFLGGEVTIRQPAALTPADWRAHLPLLRTSFPRWQFGADPWRS
jgi:hypothetical protein